MIQITQPNPNIEIHLPNGKTLSGTRGTQIGEFLAQVKNDFSAPIVAAIINNQIHELTFPIDIEAHCIPVTMDTADGARIYRRSLVFLLEMVFAELFPKGSLNIDHSVSSGGFYCEVTGREALTRTELDSLKLHMKKMIAIALLSGLMASPAWALFENNKQLAATATVTLEDAIRHALKAVPGKAVEAEIGKEDGRTVYEVEIIDSNNKTQKVYVDAQSGQTKIDR